MTQIMPNDATDFLPTRRSLLSRLKHGDDQAGWHTFFDTYWKLIYGMAIKAGLTDAEAQDAVQETVLAVSKHIGRFKYDPAKCSFKTWLLLLTRQRIAQQFQKRPPNHAPNAGDGSLTFHGRHGREATRTGTMDQIPDPRVDPLEAVWDEEWRKHLLATATERVKRQVKAEQFQIFDFYVLQGWPVREVARVLSVSVAQVYLGKHRVGALLKKELKRLAQGL